MAQTVCIGDDPRINVKVLCVVVLPLVALAVKIFFYEWVPVSCKTYEDPRIKQRADSSNKDISQVNIDLTLLLPLGSI